ncbi:MAG: Nudix family hydrolase [Gammaproteobacteria bacterium]|nr:Nudix family hydrolase [Gammaproteobacteria bacterium]
MASAPIHVAAAVIRDARGRTLLTKRPEHLHQGGLWEFPGGKLELGETIWQALRREIREELGLQLLGHRPLIRNLHHYPDKSVLLDVHLVTDYQGIPVGLEGQPLEWVEPGCLSDYPMPAADLPVVRAIDLPDRYLITGPDPTRQGQFLNRLEQALGSGLRLVQLRAGDIPDDELLELGRGALELCHAKGARLLLNSSPELAEEIGADGVHLNSRRLHQQTERPLPETSLIAASCHTEEELSHAAAIGLDFAVLSPVQTTGSHPEAEPLGWGRFRGMVDSATIPVYALGGMRQSDLNTAWEHGAQGIAGISCFWN